MTESEALEILDLIPTATKEVQQSAFYNLRAGLSEQTKIAPTPMLRERFTKRLSKVYEAQRVLGLRFSEEDPDGIDPLFRDFSERAVENNLPTTDDGKNNLPARENQSSSSEEIENVSEESFENPIIKEESVSESLTLELNEAKYREAVLTALENGKGEITDEDSLTAKQIQLDIPQARANEIIHELIAIYIQKQNKVTNSSLRATPKIRRLKEMKKLKKVKREKPEAEDYLQKYKWTLIWTFGIPYIFGEIIYRFEFESNLYNFLKLFFHFVASLIYSKIISLHIANIAATGDSLIHFIKYTIIFYLIIIFTKDQSRLGGNLRDSIYMISFCTLSIYLIPTTLVHLLRKNYLTNRLTRIKNLRFKIFLIYLLGFLIAIFHIIYYFLKINYY